MQLPKCPSRQGVREGVWFLLGVLRNRFRGASVCGGEVGTVQRDVLPALLYGYGIMQR